jgi:hypothetical protein
MILTSLLATSLAFVATITPDVAMAAYERPVERIEVSPAEASISTAGEPARLA